MIRITSLMLTLAILAGCAVSTDKGISVSGARSGKNETSVREADGNLPRTIAVLPFSNDTDSDFAYSVVRRVLSNHFSTKNYRMLHWQDVDNRLSLAGIESPEQVADRSRAELREILGVDGLIEGKITHFNKTFAGVYAQISIGVELQMSNVEDEIIWEVKNIKRSHAGGISTTPVGLLVNALVAGKHLYGDINLFRAADDLGRELAKDMPEPEGLSQRERPDINNVVHSGVNQYLKYGDTLEIGIEGTPGMKAVASVEGIGIVDLEEVEPGQYIGKLTIDKTLNVNDMSLVGRLQDDFNQTTSWVSPYGLVNIDNTAPGAVSEVAAVSRDGAIDANWSAPGDDDITGYRVSWANSETGDSIASIDAANSQATIADLENFSEVYLRIVAIDRAGNEGTAVPIAAMAAPDARFSTATDAANTLPTKLEGVQRLTAAGSPYYLRGPVSIAPDGVLLVAPGVEIQVAPNARLTVFGELHSFGSHSNQIKVTATNDQVYDEFLVLRSSADVSVAGLHVTMAGTPIKIESGSPRISECTVVNPAYSAVSITGSARPLLTGNVFEGAKIAGVLVEGQSQPIFKDNRFVNNDPFQVQNVSSYELDMTGNQFEPTATVLGEVKL